MVTQATLKYMGIKADDDLGKLTSEARDRLYAFSEALDKAGKDLVDGFSWIALSQARVQAGQKEITDIFGDMTSGLSQAKNIAEKFQNTLAS